MTKTCSKCKQELPVSDFVRHKPSPGGYRSKCKECLRADNHQAMLKRTSIQKQDSSEWLTNDVDLDPVETILQLTARLEGLRNAKDTLSVNDRDRWLVTLVLELLSDPNHHIGKEIGKQAFKTWVERGGRLPGAGYHRIAVIDRDQLEHALLYLSDLGVSNTDLTKAFSLGITRIGALLKQARNDQSIK